jgi:anti-sigma factor RsiW
MTSPNTTMDSQTKSPISEDDLHALLDGRLSGVERLALETRLAHDAVATATLNAWRQQADSLRGLHSQVRQEAVPPSLLAATQHVTGAQLQLDQWRRWGGMAAGVMLAFGVGWLSHGQWQLAGPPGPQTLSKAQNSRQFVHQAALAHAVYTPEVRHPVEVSAAQQEHLVQWLSKRLGKPLKVPNLSSQGFELVGGRLLPGEEGARAQFMFQNGAGERITLYLGALNASAKGPSKDETAFRFSAEGPVPGFYWVDHGFGYALAGHLPRDGLMKLAEAVYPQL